MSENKKGSEEVQGDSEATRHFADGSAAGGSRRSRGSLNETRSGPRVHERISPDFLAGDCRHWLCRVGTDCQRRSWQDRQAKRHQGFRL